MKIPVFKEHRTVLETTEEYTAKIITPEYKVERIPCIRRTFYTKSRKEIAKFSGKPNDPICFMAGKPISATQKAEIKRVCKTDKETEYFYLKF
jgi:hypothetical protein